MLKQACNNYPAMTASELYAGQHWNRAVAAAARTGTELWVISAGLGFLHVTDRVVPYEATFNSMPFRPREIWQELTSRPPLKRRFTSLNTLMRERPNDRFVIAASPVYLRAVEEDLNAGRDALTSPDQLTIVTTKEYMGVLRANVTYASAEMMKALNTNMTGLNISYALPIIEKESMARTAG